MIRVTPVPAFRDNYIWMVSTDGSDAVVAVDPGESAPVEAYLKRKSLTLSGILVTHHHHDHVGGVRDLVAHRDIPVWGPAGEHIPCRTRALAHDDRVAIDELGGLELTVLEVPGHTAGHIAYHGTGMLFCGDTLFAGGCGRLFEGTPGQMRTSLDLLRTLPADTAVCCAHEYTQANLTFAVAVEPGNRELRERLERVRELRRQGHVSLPSSMDEETRTNPFLRWDQESVMRSAEAQAGCRLDSADEVFATVRRWKDGF